MKPILSLFAAAVSIAAVFADEPDTIWKNLDKHHFLSGPAELSPLDLEGNVVFVMRYKATDLKDSMVPIFSDVYNMRKGKEFSRYVEICSVTGEKKDVDDFPLLIKKRKTNNASLASYWNFGLAKDDPASDKSPFFYVVDHKGKVVASGDDLAKVRPAAAKAIKAMGTVHPFFGATPLTQPKLAAVTNMLAEGKSTMPAMAFLKKYASGKGPEAAEAAALMRAIEGSGHFRVGRLRWICFEAPGATSMALKSIAKMWPRLKGDPRYSFAANVIKKIPETNKLEKMLQELEELKDKDPSALKPSERKAALAKIKQIHSKADKIAESAGTAAKIEASHIGNACFSLESKFGE